jgi:hypothetical protein
MLDIYIIYIYIYTLINQNIFESIHGIHQNYSFMSMAAKDVCLFFSDVFEFLIIVMIHSHVTLIEHIASISSIGITYHKP